MLKGELRSMVGDILEEIAVVEGEVFCQQSGAGGIAIILWLGVAFREDRVATGSQYQRGKL